MKKLLTFAMGLCIATGAVAGPDMEAMMAEMQNCAVCKNMMPHMDTLGPSMTMEVVTLNDGMAVVHSISAPEHVALFHEVCAQMQATGEKAMKMSDADAQKNLCSNCRAMRSAMAAGATMHHGDTMNGDIMAITSTDPAVQAKIAEMEKAWRGMQAAMMQTAEG